MPLECGARLGPYQRGSTLELAERSPMTANSYENAPEGRFPWSKTPTLEALGTLTTDT